MNQLIGKRIVGIRSLTEAELDGNGWDRRTAATSPVLVFDDGSTLLAMCDEEGNGPGALLWRNEEGEVLLVDRRLA